MTNSNKILIHYDVPKPGLPEERIRFWIYGYIVPEMSRKLFLRDTVLYVKICYIALSNSTRELDENTLLFFAIYYVLLRRYIGPGC